jgi:hypothetical protein
MVVLSSIPISVMFSSIYLETENNYCKNKLLQYEKEMRVGLMLSDASYIKKYKGGGTYFKIAGSLKFAPFILHIHEIMYKVGYVNMIKPTIGTSTIKGKSYLYIGFST